MLTRNTYNNMTSLSIASVNVQLFFLFKQKKWHFSSLHGVKMEVTCIMLNKNAFATRKNRLKISFYSLSRTSQLDIEREMRSASGVLNRATTQGAVRLVFGALAVK
jgi:hypothetical protein